MAFSESNLKCNLNNPGDSSVFTIKHTFTLSHSVSFTQMTNKSHKYSLFAQNNFYAVSRNIEIRRSRRASQSPVKTWANFKRAVLFTLHFGLFVFAKAETEITGFMQLLQCYRWFPLTASRLWEHNGNGVTKVIFYTKSMIVFGMVYGTKVSL